MTGEAMTAEQLQRLLNAGAPVAVLDIRTAAEFAEWAIPSSVHVDVYDALKAGDKRALAGLDLAPDIPVVTVCGAGVTAALATEQLRERGLHAFTLAGGLRAWSLAWNTAEVPLAGSAASVLQIRRTGKGCLSYLIGADGEAIAIDAALDPKVYARLADERGWRITHVIDTHVHADHLSRSAQLARLVGAKLVMPATNRLAYPFQPARDGDAIVAGQARLEVIATPGHTAESTSYLLDGRALFTGDTLFLAGVGRPDLGAQAEEAHARAGALYHSLRRVVALPDATVVLPGHTSEPVPFDSVPVMATLADVRANVPALEFFEADFVAWILARIPPTPPNHLRIIEHNEAGEFPAGDPTELEAGANRCAIS